MNNTVLTWKDTVVDFLIQKGFDILGAIVIVIITAILARWLGKQIENWLAKQKLELPIRTLVVRVVKLLLFGLAGVLVLEKLGVAIGPMVTGIGVAGAGVALALQGVLSNVTAGLQLILTKRFHVGEYIEILGEHGQVANIELFSLVLIRPDGSRAVIPNKKIIGEIFHNYGTTRQASLSVGVAYDADIPGVFSTIREVLDANPRVMKDPAAGIGIASLGDSAINIGISPWVTLQDYGAAQEEIYQALIEKFREKRIEIPFPRRDVRVLNATAEVVSAA
jgi:small conductance mechanosensitive channel